jgi:glycosyltransferase involved in cell wall biosynthesis
MYPSEQKKYSGLFVLNQFNELKFQLNSNDNIDFFYMKRTMTSFLGSIVKYVLFFARLPFFIFSKKLKYDIVHVHYYFPTIYIALLYKFLFNRKVKIIVTFHGGDVDRSAKSLIYKFPLRYVDCAIAVSEGLLRKIEKFYTGNVTCISAGINNIFYSKEIEFFKKKYDILFVGSFYLHKGYDIFVNIFTGINKSLKICIAGSGELQYLTKELKTKHNITLLNDVSQEQLLEIYNDSKFLINTSRAESFGLGMTESMACGTPVLATVTDGSSQQIVNQFNGYFMPNKDINEDRDIIKEALSIDKEEYSEFSKNGIKSSHKYKLSNVVKDIIKVYKSFE